MAGLKKWDDRFMRLAQEVSTWSKDPSTQIGAVLVSPDRTDIILGYNGFARRMRDDPELYENRDIKYSRIIHGEINALALSKRPVDGYTIYTWPFLSCDRCAPVLIQAGIVRAVAPKAVDGQKERWESTLIKSRSYFAEAGVDVLEYDDYITPRLEQDPFYQKNHNWLKTTVSQCQSKAESLLKRNRKALSGFFSKVRSAI